MGSPNNVKLSDVILGGDNSTISLSDLTVEDRIAVYEGIIALVKPCLKGLTTMQPLEVLFPEGDDKQNSGINTVRFRSKAVRSKIKWSKELSSKWRTICYSLGDGYHKNRDNHEISHWLLLDRKGRLFVWQEDYQVDRERSTPRLPNQTPSETTTLSIVVKMLTIPELAEIGQVYPGVDWSIESEFGRSNLLEYIHCMVNMSAERHAELMRDELHLGYMLQAIARRMKNEGFDRNTHRLIDRVL